jgi:hypothetical protein
LHCTRGMRNARALRRSPALLLLCSLAAVVDCSPPPPPSLSQGVLRIIELLFSVVIFATMASVGGFGNFSSYALEVAVGALIFIYVFVLIITYFLHAYVQGACTYQPIIELVFDGIFIILLLAAGIAAAVQCNAAYYYGSVHAHALLSRLISVCWYVCMPVCGAAIAHSQLRGLSFAACLPPLSGGFVGGSLCSYSGTNNSALQTVINNVKSCIVFTFFELALFIGSFFFSWKENSAGEAASH